VMMQTAVVTTEKGAVGGMIGGIVTAVIIVAVASALVHGSSGTTNVENASLPRASMVEMEPH
jgi:hypothetical protein